MTKQIVSDAYARYREAARAWDALVRMHDPLVVEKLACPDLIEASSALHVATVAWDQAEEQWAQARLGTAL